jgi:hypothetical protein
VGKIFQDMGLAGKYLSEQMEVQHQGLFHVWVKDGYHMGQGEVLSRRMRKEVGKETEI